MLRSLSCLQRATLQIVGLLVICCAVAFLGVNTSRGLLVPISADILSGPDELTVDGSDIASCVIVEGGLHVTPLGTGQATVTSGDLILAAIDCSASGFVFDRFTGRYTGAIWVQCAAMFFLAGTVVILAAALHRQRKQAFFHYATPLLVGLLLLSVLILTLAAVRFLTPGGGLLESIAADMPGTLLVFSLPVLVLFALAMLVSNISLLRHEGRTWRNLFGSLIGFALSLAALLIILNSDASGSLDEVQFHSFLINFFSGMVLWTECKLAGIILCGVWAARNQPTLDKDYVLILGCRLSRKGGLTPLLRGRVDRALDFARCQQAETGRMPVLVPCGGKGTDELRSEAAAIRDYLLEQGVPEACILTEDRSANTWENLRNAQAMMKPGARVAYSTTNYHVFRAGVWASRNALQAEGMGSKTKWYYWPNAFMREYAALIAANLPHELAMIVMIGIQSGLLAYISR